MWLLILFEFIPSFFHVKLTALAFTQWQQSIRKVKKLTFGGADVSELTSAALGSSALVTAIFCSSDSIGVIIRPDSNATAAAYI